MPMNSVTQFRLLVVKILMLLGAHLRIVKAGLVCSMDFLLQALRHTALSAYKKGLSSPPSSKHSSGVCGKHNSSVSRTSQNKRQHRMTSDNSWNFMEFSPFEKFLKA